MIARESAQGDLTRRSSVQLQGGEKLKKALKNKVRIIFALCAGYEPRENKDGQLEDHKENIQALIDFIKANPKKSNEISICLHLNIYDKEKLRAWMREMAPLLQHPALAGKLFAIPGYDDDPDAITIPDYTTRTDYKEAQQAMNKYREQLLAQGDREFEDLIDNYATSFYEEHKDTCTFEQVKEISLLKLYFMLSCMERINGERKGRGLIMGIDPALLDCMKYFMFTHAAKFGYKKGSLGYEQFTYVLNELVKQSQNDLMFNEESYEEDVSPASDDSDDELERQVALISGLYKSGIPAEDLGLFYKHAFEPSTKPTPSKMIPQRNKRDDRSQRTSPTSSPTEASNLSKRVALGGGRPSTGGIFSRNSQDEASRMSCQPQSTGKPKSPSLSAVNTDE